MRFHLIFILLLCSACTKTATTAEVKPSPSPVAAAKNVDHELERRLKTISDGAQGTVGLAVVHIESGKTVSINGNSQLPLYSVYKLPLAITVLKEVEEKRLQLDQKIHGTLADVVQGTPANAALWQKPVDYTIKQLLEFSSWRSDNTSSDKLVELVGGPLKVTERMRALGFQNLDIHVASGRFG